MTEESMQSVLFLCTGNYYRSRFAAILFNWIAQRDGLEWQAMSRGLKIGWPGNVGPMSPHTASRLAELGIQNDDVVRMPLQCDESDLVNADLVIAMKEAEHRAMLADQFEGWETCITYWHVHDLDAATPQEALAEIEQLVSNLIDRLKSEAAL